MVRPRGRDPSPDASLLLLTLRHDPSEGDRLIVEVAPPLEAS
jgi:hypothetical protein